MIHGGIRAQFARPEGKKKLHKSLERRKKWVPLQSRLKRGCVPKGIAGRRGAGNWKNFQKRFGEKKISFYLCNPEKTRDWKSGPEGPEYRKDHWKDWRKVQGSKYRNKMNESVGFFRETNRRGQARNLRNIQRRVWSWLRMNASGRLNTCKSRGSAM